MRPWIITNSTYRLLETIIKIIFRTPPEKSISHYPCVSRTLVDIVIKPPPIHATIPEIEDHKKANITTTLGNISETSGKILSTINHLQEVFQETMENTTE